MEPIVYKLQKSIEAHGEAVTELTFREPTGKDILKCGFPLRVDDSGGFVEPAMHRMIGVLAQIPPSSVDMLSFSDWLGAAATVAGFLRVPVAT